MIGIICDSGADVRVRLGDTPQLEIIPLHVSLGKREFVDGPGMTDKVLSWMGEGVPKTSAPSYGEAREGFERLLAEGCDKIVGITISSGLSGTYEVFSLVAQDLKKEKDGLNIEVIDSRNISIGTGFLVRKAAVLREKGEEFSSLLATLKEAAAEKVEVFFTLPTLRYLQAGGRIGRVKATLGRILNVKPIISVDEKGVYYTAAQARGMKRAVRTMIEQVIDFVGDGEVKWLCVGITEATEETRRRIERIKEKLYHMGCDIDVQRISASLTVHTGSGLIGIGAMLC